MRGVLDAPEVTMVLRLILAAGLAAIVGYQRERAEKPAGLRTHILVAVGAALFTVVSVSGFGPGGDPARLAAQIVTGIGFLGAGTILRANGHVRGLTTAASIWAVASIGVAVGVGMYLMSLAASLIVVAVLQLGRVPHRRAEERRRWLRASRASGWICAVACSCRFLSGRVAREGRDDAAEGRPAATDGGADRRLPTGE